MAFDSCGRSYRSRLDGGYDYCCHAFSPNLGLTTAQRNIFLEISGDVVERALESLADFVNVLALDDERGSKHEAIADYTEDQSVTQRSGVNPRTHLKRTVEGNAFLIVLHQLHAEDRSRSSDVANKWMLLQPTKR